MAREANGSSKRLPLQFEAPCAWCGPVRFAVGAVVLHVRSRAEALFEFTCPECERVNVRRLEEDDLEVLLRAGLRPSRGPAPFELLEHPSGPPIGWDDIIDFHEALHRLEASTSGLEEAARPAVASKSERDAA